jgi:hypothetical protein
VTADPVTDPVTERDAVRAFVAGDLTRGQFLDIVGYDPVGIMAEAREQAKARPPKRDYKRRDGIDQLPSGRWRVRYSADGKSLSKSFPSYAEALAFRDEQRVAVRKGTPRRAERGQRDLPRVREALACRARRLAVHGRRARNPAARARVRRLRPTSGSATSPTRLCGADTSAT